MKTVYGHVYTLEYLKTAIQEDVYISSPKVYRGIKLDRIATITHVLCSETGMSVAKLMRLLQFIMYSKIPQNGKDTAETLPRVYENVPQLITHLIS